MITGFILGLSLLILVSFIVDIIGDKIRIPSVILLMGVGVVLHYSFNALYMEQAIRILPFLGTFALILVVIEAGFDLDYEPQKRRLIAKALGSAFFNVAACLSVITAVIYWYYEDTLLKSLIYAIPFSIVSSAIAIPTAKPLDALSKEFLTYETVFSDVIGILLFNLFITSEKIGPAIVFPFIGNLTVSIVLSIVLSIAMVFMMKRLKHKVRFVPIFSALILIYAAGKYLNLPLLITMMVFGMVLNNIDNIKIPHIHIGADKKLMIRINHFKRLTHELTFVVRGLFFTVFGYRLDLVQFINPWMLLIVAALIIFVFAVRLGFLKVLRSEVSGAVGFIAPRGLISILLALSIPEKHYIAGFHGEILDIFIIASILLQLTVRKYVIEDLKPPKVKQLVMRLRGKHPESG